LSQRERGGLPKLAPAPDVAQARGEVEGCYTVAVRGNTGTEGMTSHLIRRGSSQDTEDVPGKIKSAVVKIRVGQRSWLRAGSSKK